MDKHGITTHTTYNSVYLAHHEIFRAKVGNGGINYRIHENVLPNMRRNVVYKENTQAVATALCWKWSLNLRYITPLDFIYPPEKSENILMLQ